MKKHPLFTFLTLHGLLWSVASLAFFKINSFFTDPLGLLFTAVFIIGHMFLFSWFVGVVSGPFYFVGPRTVRGVAVGLSSLLSILLAIDIVVFAQYRFHIGLAMLELFFGPAGKEIFVFPLSMWILTGAGICAVVALEIGLWMLAQRWAFAKKGVVTVLLIWLGCFVLYNGLYAWGKFKLVPSIMAQRKVLPLAQPLSANRRLEAWGFQAPKNPYSVPKNGSLNYPLAELSCRTSSAPKNILIFLIDSWRADTFNAEIMPLLSAWAQKPGMHVFNNHLSGGNGTDAGVFSIFYSLTFNYWDDITALQRPPLLLARALEQGYEPAIFASSKLTSPPFYRNVFASITNLRIGSEGATSWERDEDAVAGFEQFLAHRKKDVPFFGFIFLDAPHGYSYPEEDKIFTPAKAPNYFLLSNNTDPTPIRNQYNNAVHFSDRMVDRTLQALQKQGLLKDTLVIITGDHGQEINDSHHNFWGHNGNLTDYQTKVPLLLYQDNSLDFPAQVDYRTTHYDIVPTLLQEIFRCTNPAADYAMGYSLFDTTPREFSLFAGHTEKAIRVGDDILVLDNFGNAVQYNHKLEPVTAPLPAALIKEGLQSFHRFYK